MIGDAGVFKFGQGTYRDRGCPEQGGCDRSLNCHRPDGCVLDTPAAARRREMRDLRYRRIMQLRQGRTAPEVAELLGISDRVVYRAIREGREHDAEV